MAAYNKDVHAQCSNQEHWLEAIHQQWVATLDAVRDAIFVVDSSNRIIRANYAFAKLAKRSVADLAGQYIGDLLPWIIDEEGAITSVVNLASDGRLYRLRDSSASERLSGHVYILEDITVENSFAQAEESYRQDSIHSLVETINALSEALNAIDPYTAQHGKTVAGLSKQIAKKIGYDDFEAQGIYYGAQVHDIGKLSVPSGILHRSGKLAQAEINLIRMHPETGYSIVKDLHFPWPVHEIILQHHERMDGSGYPFGLEGSDIAMHARIVGVADVVEAMSSHRPYRPALGVEAAMSELKDGQGRLYDAEVVGACLEAINEDSSSVSIEAISD